MSITFSCISTSPVLSRSTMEKWDGYITSRRQEERLIEGSSGDDGGGGGCGVDDLGNGHTPACRHQSHENNPDKDIST